MLKKSLPLLTLNRWFTKTLLLYDTNHDYHEGVWLCAAAFVLAGAFALFVNADKPVTQDA